MPHNIKRENIECILAKEVKSFKYKLTNYPISIHVQHSPCMKSDIVHHKYVHLFFDESFSISNTYSGHLF